MLSQQTLQGHADWSSPPSDAGDYNSHPGKAPSGASGELQVRLLASDEVPGDAAFFQNGYQSDFGRFFLKWYGDEAWQRLGPRPIPAFLCDPRAEALLQHGAEVLQRAKQVT